MVGAVGDFTLQSTCQTNHKFPQNGGVQSEVKSKVLLASYPGSQEGGGERERRAWYLLMMQFLTTMTNFDSR